MQDIIDEIHTSASSTGCIYRNCKMVELYTEILHSQDYGHHSKEYYEQQILEHINSIVYFIQFPYNKEVNYPNLIRPI